MQNISYPTVDVRLWRRRPWVSNGLVRAVDRVQTLVAVGAVSFLLAMVPIAAAIGTTQYVARRDQGIVDTSLRHRTSAVVTDDTPPSAAYARYTGSTATWTFGGTEHTGRVSTPPTASRGDRVEIWVLGDGTLTQQPATGVGAATLASLVAVGAWATAAGVALLGFLGIRALFDRRRAESWERSWMAMDSQKP